MTKEKPTLSLTERNRRWTLIREMMAEKGLDCLFVGGLNAKPWARFDTYLSNENGLGVVIFPLEGDPTYLAYPGMLFRKDARRLHPNGESWIADWKGAFGGHEWSQELKDKGFSESNIGVVGLDSLAPYELEGIIPFRSWNQVLHNLPNAKFIEVSEAYGEVMRVKSSEEIEMYRHSAKIGEKACETMLEGLRSGADERDIFSNVISTIYRHGADPAVPLWSLNHGAGDPLWMDQGGQSRILKPGDTLWSEILVIYGGFQTQHHITAAVEPVADDILKSAKAAEASLQAGLSALKPGVKFTEVATAMETEVADKGFWHIGPLIHALNPQTTLNGRMGVGTDYLGIEKNVELHGIPVDIGGEMEIKPWTCFELEPDAGLETRGVMVGCSALVTDIGAEFLGSPLTEKMHIVS